jgi:hypothetical protein
MDDSNAKTFVRALFRLCQNGFDVLAKQTSRSHPTNTHPTQHCCVLSPRTDVLAKNEKGKHLVRYGRDAVSRNRKLR